MSKIINILNKINLQLFNNTNKTSDTDLSDEMKTYYDDNLIDNAKPHLVHGQFAQKRPIPKGKGKTIEFRKYSPLPKATTPLSEGVTPSGRKLEVSNITATVQQYGDYVEISDMLELTAVDNNLVEATELLGDQSGLTLDTLTRDILNAGTNVQYYDDSVSSRHLITSANKMSVAVVKRSERNLKNVNATKFDDSFVAIVHPDVAYDIKSDSNFIDIVKYQDATRLFTGEIGKISGVRFVETTEAKIFRGADLSASARTLTVASYLNKVITLDETLTADDATALAGREIIVDGVHYDVVSATTTTITVKEAPATNTPADGDVVYPGEAGAEGRSIYSTLVIAKNAYGETEIEGGGLQNIVKQLGSAGASDPLSQRATSGWKATHTAEILTEEFILRVETCSTFDGDAN